jgi:hypothetical protein
MRIMRIKCDIYVSYSSFFTNNYSEILYEEHDIVEIIGKYKQKELDAFVVNAEPDHNISRYPCSSEVHKIFYFQDRIGVALEQNN